MILVSHDYQSFYTTSQQLCACQIGMHNNHRDFVHAKLACTTTLWLLCMPIWHAQKPQGKTYDMLTQMALDIHNEYSILVMNQIR
jgi:hypothetical protein